MNKEKLFHIISKKVISEKYNMVSKKHNQIIFYVTNNAIKRDIKEIIEKTFKVIVNSVCIVNIRGKKKIFCQRIGRRKKIKKSIYKYIF